MSLGTYLSSLVGIVQIIVIVLLIKEILGIGYKSAESVAKSEVGQKVGDKVSSGTSKMNEVLNPWSESNQRASEADDTLSQLEEREEQEENVFQKIVDSAEQALNILSSNAVDSKWKKFSNEVQTVIDAASEDGQLQALRKQDENGLKALQKKINKINQQEQQQQSHQRRFLEQAKQQKQILDKALEEEQKGIGSVEDFKRQIEEVNNGNLDHSAFKQLNNADSYQDLLNFIEEQVEGLEDSSADDLKTLCSDIKDDLEDHIGPDSDEDKVRQVLQNVDEGLAQRWADAEDEDRAGVLEAAIQQLESNIEALQDLVKAENDEEAKESSLEDTLENAKDFYKANVGQFYHNLQNIASSLQSRMRRAAQEHKKGGVESMTAKQVRTALTRIIQQINESQEDRSQYRDLLQEMEETVQEIRQIQQSEGSALGQAPIQ